MNDLLREGRAAAAVERQSNFAPQLGLVARLCDEIERLRAVLVAAKRFYEVCWLVAGSPLEIAAKYGPDFAPPNEKEVKQYAHAMRDAIEAAEGRET